MSVVEDFWSGLGARGRQGLVAGAVLIAVVAGLLSAWVFRQEYGVLFSELDDESAAAITAELETLKVPYQLHKDGSEIRVEQSAVHEARLKLTGTGVLSRGGVGFELFDDAEYGMTDFAQKINYQRALQGELARTIMSLAEVSQARVHLVLPQSTLFKRQDLNASASISLVLVPGAVLGKEQVRGIQQLVAAAVSELAESDVMILDQKGRALTQPLDSEADLLGSRLEKKRRIEDYLQAKVRTILDQLYGEGIGIVNIDVTVNYDQVERQVEEVLPGDGGERGLVLRSADTRVRKVQAPRTEQQDEPARADDIVNESAEVEYKLGKAIERVVRSVGNISRITTSVLVPAGTAQTDIEALHSLVGTAVGVNGARGDVVEIRALLPALAQASPPLSTALPDAGPQALPARPAPAVTAPDRFGLPLADWVLGAGVIVLLLLLLIARLAAGPRVERLDSTGREAVLLELKTWLNDDEDKRAVLR